jgi:hypothetical protein
MRTQNGVYTSSTKMKFFGDFYFIYISIESQIIALLQKCYRRYIHIIAFALKGLLKAFEKNIFLSIIALLIINAIISILLRYLIALL